MGASRGSQAEGHRKRTLHSTDEDDGDKPRKKYVWEIEMQTEKSERRNNPDCYCHLSFTIDTSSPVLRILTLYTWLHRFCRYSFHLTRGLNKGCHVTEHASNSPCKSDFPDNQGWLLFSSYQWNSSQIHWVNLKDSWLYDFIWIFRRRKLLASKGLLIGKLITKGSIVSILEIDGEKKKKVYYNLEFRSSLLLLRFPSGNHS